MGPRGAGGSVLIAVLAVMVLFLSVLFSMLGMGGALLYIPMFHAFGYDFKAVAIPAGLLLNGVTGVTASIVYIRSKMVDVKGSIPLVMASFLGAPLGAVLTRYVSTHTLILLFSIGMVVAGGRMLRHSAAPDKEGMMSPAKRIPLMAVGGFAIGILAGLLGIGGGFLFVPLMLAVGYPTKRAAATSSFAVVFSSFSGFLGHLAEGHFHWPLMAACGVAALVGAWFGANLMRDKMKPEWIKRIFAMVLLMVAAKMLWKLYT